mmetsp:Transcript_33702/g.68711  ORF Transcript_33702/g.68711 Transcript_33702/m.68711 type:complete len:391 (+) Transcript_33702:108-1280(+)
MTTKPTLAQQRAIAYSSKPFAALSLFASLYVLHHLIKNPNKTTRMYHRLIGCMNAFISVQTIFILWGNWAVPEGTPFFAGASGTVQTCTVQGFFVILASISVASYYASLSICSYVSVKHNFKEENYKWIEKWIHFVCTILPLAYSSWMAATENINPFGSGCFVASSPLGCQADPEVKCERGSDQNFALIIIGLSQIVTYFIIPPCSMMALYKLLHKAKKEHQSSKGMKQLIEGARKRLLRDVMIQISLYLFSFWATYFFSLIAFITQTVTGEKPYSLLIFSNVVLHSQGFIVMLVYFQLGRRSQKDRHKLPKAPECKGRNLDSNLQTIRMRASMNESDMGASPRVLKKSVESTFNIFDGIPDESSPWAKYIDQDSEDDDSDDVVDDFGME